MGAVYLPGKYSVQPWLSGHPSTWKSTDAGVGAGAGTAGAETLANGSAIGDAGDTHDPVVPPLKLLGAVSGRPKLPKLLPVSCGPPLLRSMVPLPLQALDEASVADAQL